MDAAAGLEHMVGTGPDSSDTSTLPAIWSGPTKRRVTCPHCWHRLHLGDALWIARHASLRGDAVAGEDAMRRFLPTRFDVSGRAIDAGGEPCHELACGRCRLPIPRALLEANQLFLSLVGVPGSGKSYLTAAMSWTMRPLLPQKLGWSFQDVDASGNATLIANEQTLFLRDDPDTPVSIEKTQLQGAHYDPVRFGDRQVQLARPFQFLLRPEAKERFAQGEELPSPRVLNLYDNAGEHFLPGQDSALSPGTQHVARANAVMFLFDPLQDPRCRRAIQGFRAGPGDSAARPQEPQLDPKRRGEDHGVRQDTVLNEMALRVRRYGGLSETAKLEQPLLVLVGKADAWLDQAGLSWGQEPEPVTPRGDGTWCVDTGLIERVSAVVRGWLVATTPEFVSLAEASHRVVRYLPVSALGGPPQAEPDGRLVVRPGRVSPRWVTAPLLYAMSKWSADLLPGGGDSLAVDGAAVATGGVG